MRASPLALSALLTLFAACEGSESDDDSGAATDGDPGTPQRPPTQAASLRRWLEDGTYKDWAAESAIHPSTGPHFGNVRTWVNDAAIGGLQSGALDLPVAAATVKELYGNGQSRRGWSVSVKTEAALGGDGWYWFEYYDGDVLANEQGLGVCVGCHGDGTDFVLTPFPLE